MKKQLGFAYHFYYSFWNLVLSPFKFLNFITVNLFGFKLIKIVPCTIHYVRKHAVDDLLESIKDNNVNYDSVCFKEEGNLFKIKYYDKINKKHKQCELCMDCKALQNVKKDLNILKVLGCGK